MAVVRYAHGDGGGAPGRTGRPILLRAPCKSVCKSGRSPAVLSEPLSVKLPGITVRETQATLGRDPARARRGAKLASLPKAGAGARGIRLTRRDTFSSAPPARLPTRLLLSPRGAG